MRPRNSLVALATSTLVAAILLGLSMQASAIVMSLQPDFQLAEPGDSVAVVLQASDFGTTGVSSYEIDLTWDATALALTFQFPFGALGFPGGSIITGGPTAANAFEATEVSLLTELELLAEQGTGPIPLIFFEFEVLALPGGMSTFIDLTVQSVSAADGTPYTDVVVRGAEVSNVPAPGTLMLFGLGLLGLGARRSRSTRQV